MRAPDHYRAGPGLLAGEHPAGPDDAATAARLVALRELGVTAFVDLTETGEVAAYEHLVGGAAYHRRPIPDFGVPADDELRATLDLLDELVAAGATVYLHCRGGLGRTGTVVSCRLVREGVPAAEVPARLATLRAASTKRDRDSPETAEQRALVARWT